MDGNPIDFTPEEVSMIKKVMGMKLDQLDNIKDWYEATEALDHLLTNGDLGLIPHIVNKYENAVAVAEGTKVLIDKFKGNISMLPITKFFENISATISKLIDIHGNDKAKHKDSYNMKIMLEGRSYRGWDNLFKNWKDYGIYEKVFYALAKGQANYKTLLKKMDADRIGKELFKANHYDQRKTLISKYKITAFLRQLEFESNPGSKNVHPAIGYLNATVEASRAGNHPIQRKALEMLEGVIKDYSSEGQISLEALRKSFTPAEKKAIADLQAMYKELLPYHTKVSLGIRNKAFKPLENYSHISAHGTPETGASALETKKNQLLSALGTKTRTINERGTPTAINLDPFSTANIAIRDVMLDYWMTNPFRNVEKILNNFKKYSEEELAKQNKGNSGYENAITRMNIASAFKDIYEDARQNMLGRSYYESSAWKDLIQLMGKRAVQYVLGTPTRLLAELTSNMSYIMKAVPDEFMLGLKYSEYNKPEMLSEIMVNLGSSATERLNPHGGFSSSVMDTQDFDISVADNQNAVSEGTRRALQAYYYTLGKPIGFGQKINEIMITKGDLATAIPVWTGSMAMEFKALTGKDINFDKIKNKDAEYMDKYEDALAKSTAVADRKVTDVASSKNPFEVAPKMTHKSTQVLQAINKYMSGFRMTEYEMAADAIMHLYKGGKMSREQALNTIEAITARAASYKAIQTVANTLFTTMLTIGMTYLNEEDKTPEQKKMDKMLGAEGPMTPEKKIEVAKKWMEIYGTPNSETGTALMTTDKDAIKYEKRIAEESPSLLDDAFRGIAQQALSLLTQRNFGNIINGVNAYIFEEYINKKARESMGMDYNPYTDNYLYNKVPDITKRNWLAGTLEANLGAYGVPASIITEMVTKGIEKIKLEKQLDEVNQLIADHKAGVPVADGSYGAWFDLNEKKDKIQSKINDENDRLLKELAVSIGIMSGAIPALKNIDKTLDKRMQGGYRVPKDIDRIEKNIDLLSKGISPKAKKEDAKEVSKVFKLIETGEKVPTKRQEGIERGLIKK